MSHFARISALGRIGWKETEGMGHVTHTLVATSVVSFMGGYIPDGLGTYIPGVLMKTSYRFNRFLDGLPRPFQYLIAAPIVWLLVMKQPGQKLSLVHRLLIGLSLLWLLFISLPSLFVYLLLQPLWRRVLPR